MNASVLTASVATSFSRMFQDEIHGHHIQAIEIPLIQRDYAQGRDGDSVARIRGNFVDTLCRALLPGASTADLDFVFGEIEYQNDEYRFHPLDGQQRLTTLFLLHCYLAWHTGIAPAEQAWSKFSYATRASARDFCAFLTRCRPDAGVAPSAWLLDDAAFLPTWQHDPSIRSMLVVLDALDEWFRARDIDLHAAWQRLIDPREPAIRFHVLPMRANGLTDTLYIKMNSRGKPLTGFENFKAHFEESLEKNHPLHAHTFATKIDKEWSDLLWPYRGTDQIIDDEFLRYFNFITDVLAWNGGIDLRNKGRMEDRADLVYGPGADSNVAFLLQAWQVWEDKDIRAAFEQVFVRAGEEAHGRVPTFKVFSDEGVNLFEACCRHYGTQKWTHADTLLLYAVLLAHLHPPADMHRAIRVVRNLVEASDDEIRAGERNNMPRLLSDIEHIVKHDDLAAVRAFNQVQVRNERDKASLLSAVPALRTDVERLEDHDLLRGGLTVFDLAPERFAARSAAFLHLFDKSSASDTAPWHQVTGALLAAGDYGRKEGRWTGYRAVDLGAPRNDEPWTRLFRGKQGEVRHPASTSLMALLDALAGGSTPEAQCAAYLGDTSTAKDWRYYFVKYDAMRKGTSGRYMLDSTGYRACMLDHLVMRSYYYDPYLLAAVRRSGIERNRIANEGWPRCFYGYENEPRQLKLRASDIGIECVETGWKLVCPALSEERLSLFQRVCAGLGVGADLVLAIPQQDGIDVEDRIERGAALLAALVDAGL
jgi:hypothetical protein